MTLTQFSFCTFTLKGISDTEISHTHCSCKHTQNQVLTQDYLTHYSSECECSCTHAHVYMCAHACLLFHSFWRLISQNDLLCGLGKLQHAKAMIHGQVESWDYWFNSRLGQSGCDKSLIYYCTIMLHYANFQVSHNSSSGRRWLESNSSVKPETFHHFIWALAGAKDIFPRDPHGTSVMPSEAPLEDTFF